MTPTPETEEVRKKARRAQLARAEKSGAWKYLANVGVLGWVFMVPVLLGLFLGRLVALRTGSRAPLLVGLLAGLVLGAWGTWRQVRRSLLDDPGEPK
jgi:ATP synthase protein I